MTPTSGTSGAGFSFLVSVASGGDTNFLFGPLSPGDIPLFLIGQLQNNGSSALGANVPSISLYALTNSPSSAAAILNGRNLFFTQYVGTANWTALAVNTSPATSFRMPIPRLDSQERYLGVVISAGDVNRLGWIGLDVDFVRPLVVDDFRL